MIQKPFSDDNPEDRAFWSWLKLQPKDAWLLYARQANWDNADWIFEEMADDPSCDRAVVSWIFWGCDPGFFVRTPGEYRPDRLIAKIVTNAGRGYYKSAELYCDRFELVHPVQGYLGALEAAGGAAPFRLPRELCGPFDGRPARLPSAYDAQTERDLAEIFAAIDGGLPRSEGEHWQQQEKGGNLWIKEVFALPAVPAAPLTSLRHLDDAGYVQAIFGRHADYVAACRRNWERRHGPASSGRRYMRTLIVIGILGALVIAGALIAHRIRTGFW